jgi:hypothetical protein
MAALTSPSSGEYMMDDSSQVEQKSHSKSTSSPSMAAQGVRGEVVVNVRFQPNGLVLHINNKPQDMGDQEWFDRLCRVASTNFMALSGGRGAFRIPGDQFQLIWEANS